MLTRVLCSLLAFGLIGCGGSSTLAPVEDRYGRSSPASPGRAYAVQRGETLYSIAFRYGLDYRKVAAANGIPYPYTIFPGQKIVLLEAPPAPVKRVAAATTTTTPRLPVSTRPAPVVQTPTSPAVARPPATAVTKPQPVTQVPAAGAATPAAAAGAGPGAGAVVKAWRWPTAGRVTRGYSSSVHKGIDIGGTRGDAIYAVADGTVVYSGTGIVGFGELLIIKHNQTYLSAYGHNDRLLVAEGENVRAGQKIAEKGSSGTDTVKLHFEIRKEGKPVNPQRLLPRR